MTTLTERQYRRRAKILAVARELITKQGYDGVTMRELAAKSGVTPKTLYHQFGNKEKLLHSAVEERFRHTYQAIDDQEIAKGIDRLLFIIEAVADSTRKNIDYAKSLAPLLGTRRSTTFAQIRIATYRKAIAQIDEEGDFVDWIDTEVITAMIYRQVNPLYLNWWCDDDSEYALDEISKLDICLILRSITTGYTHKIATKTIQDLQNNAKNFFTS